MGRGVNLIPAPLLTQRRERRRSQLGLRVMAAYLSLLLIGTLGYLGVHAPRAADADAGDSAVSADRLTLLHGEVTKTQQQLLDTNRRLEGGRVLSERPNWGTLLRLIALTAGEPVFLREVSVSTTGPTIGAGADVRLGGIAADPWAVSSFVLRLEESKLFDRVTIESSGRAPYQDRTATSFVLICVLSSAEDSTPAEGR